MCATWPKTPTTRSPLINGTELIWTPSRTPSAGVTAESKSVTSVRPAIFRANISRT